MGYCKEVTEHETYLRRAFSEKVIRLWRAAKFIRKCRDLTATVKSHSGTYPHVAMLLTAEYNLNVNLTVSIRHIKATGWVLDKAEELGLSINRGEPTVTERGHTYSMHEKDAKGTKIAYLAIYFVLVTDGTSKCRMVVEKKELVEWYNTTYKVVCDDNRDSENDNANPTP